MTSKHLSHPKYRRDIDGLRAIAVLAVVGFHAAPGKIPGGFIGVDIFFVISGYLITTIIIKNLEKGSFSFIEFYRRRIRRIFPALIVVLLASLVAGSLLLTPEQYENLGKHIAGGAGFYSNFLLWTESGYFDSTSEMKPLLHLWSLSIEEQFYIVWPLLLWLLFTRKISWLGTSIIIVLLSFSLNAYTASNDATAAFYSPMARSWELLAGALLAYVFVHKINHSLYGHDVLINTISFAGAAFIVTGFYIIDKHRAFPGWWAVLPVLGTMLLILAGPQALINRFVLSNRLLVWFGLISYPLYLTHWPILSFLRIMESGEIAQVYRIYAVAVSIGLAWLIFNFVEKPIRFGGYSRVKIISLISSMAIIGIYGFYVYSQHGIVARISSQPHVVNMGDIGQRKFFEYMNNKFFLCTPKEFQTGSWEEYKRCYQSHKGETNQVAILGDSHAEHLFIGLAEAFSDIDVVYYANTGMPFLNNSNYDEIFHFLLRDNNIKAVIISAHWARDLRGIESNQLDVKFSYLVSSIIDSGKRVYIIDDVPQFQFGPGKCKYSGRFGQENTCSQHVRDFDSEREKYHSIFDTLSKKFPGLTIVDTRGFFCNDQYCFMAKDGSLYFRDNHHLNVYGSKAFGKYIFQNYPVLHNIQSLIE